MASNIRRLRGLETEYCLRFSPASGGEHPGNAQLYDAILASLGDRAPLHESDSLTRQTFLPYGGAINYEALPGAPQGGLLEASTPECTGPRQLLLYQRAQQRLLLEALPGALRRLQDKGFDGELGLLKNCRDAEGHVYGAQESYDCELATGPALWAYRTVLVALVPAFVAACLVSLSLMLFGVLALVCAGVVEGLRGALRQAPPDDDTPKPADDHFADEELGDLTKMALLPWFAPLAVQARALAWFGFPRMQHGLVPFLLSRPVISGCGVLGVDGDMTLSEKAPDMVHTMRLDMRQHRRAVLDTGNLLKPMQALIGLRLRDAGAAFRQRQRLQVGLGDSNVATVAEYLKIATTGLVVDMAEAGWLQDAPQPADPMEALRIWTQYITLTARAPMRQGKPMSALGMQRYYLERGRAWVQDSDTASLEEIETVRVWQDVLDLLESDPEALVGHVDWVTKRWLIQSAGQDLPWEARMKIALRYHELGTGYLAQLEAHDIAPDLLVEDDVIAAMDTPPDDSPAAIRAEILRSLANSTAPVRVSWDHVRVGNRLGKVIRLADFRRGSGP